MSAEYITNSPVGGRHNQTHMREYQAHETARRFYHIYTEHRRRAGLTTTEDFDDLPKHWRESLLEMARYALAGLV